MKTDNFSYSTPMITSPFNASIESSTVLTRIDKSVRDAEYPLIQGYNLYLPVYFPQGITDKRIFFTGNNAYKLYRKLYPRPNPRLYGPNPSYIEGALKAGWGVIVVNVADPAATHANFTVEFEFKRAAQKKKFLVHKLTANPNLLAFKWLTGDTAEDTKIKAAFDLRDDIDVSEQTYECEFNTWDIGFKNSHITGIGKDTDLESFLELKKDANKFNLSETETISADDKGNIILYGLIYNGRHAYGNKYKAILTARTAETDIDKGKVLTHKLSIMDGGNIMYDFDFANFDYTDHTSKTSYLFGGNALKACKEDLTRTESIQMFYPITHKRSDAMLYVKGIKDIEAKLKAEIEGTVKAHIPSFTLESQTPGSEFYNAVNKDFKIFERFKTDPNDLNDSPFARTNPMNKSWGELTIMNGSYIDSTIKFDGGTSGELVNHLSDHHWDWEIDYQPMDTEVYPYSPKKIPDGSGGTKLAPKTKILQDLFIECYNGSDIIDKELLDPALTPAFLMLGEGYPFAVQEAMDQFVKYQEGRISFEGSRPDCVYIRTPQTGKGFTKIDEIIGWKEKWQISRAGLANNTNTWALVGYGTYIDPDTDVPVDWSPTFGWVTGSSLLSYLVTGVADSFASGTWSKIVGWEPGSARCIPKTSLDRERLALNSLNYLVQKSDRQFYLGEDHTVMDGKESGLKSLGSMIQFGYITCYAYVTLRDNKIMNPTADNLLELKGNIEANISYYTRHFNNKVDVAMGLSTHEKEIRRRVVLATIGVTTHNFSKHSRLQMEALPADE